MAAAPTIKTPQVSAHGQSQNYSSDTVTAAEAPEPGSFALIFVVLGGAAILRVARRSKFFNKITATN